MWRERERERERHTQGRSTGFAQSIQLVHQSYPASVKPHAMSSGLDFAKGGGVCKHLLFVMLRVPRRMWECPVPHELQEPKL